MTTLPFRFSYPDEGLGRIAARFQTSPEAIWRTNTAAGQVAPGMSYADFEAALRADRFAIQIEVPPGDRAGVVEWHPIPAQPNETLQHLCDRIAAASHGDDAHPGARLRPDPRLTGHWDAHPVWFALVNAMLRYDYFHGHGAFGTPVPPGGQGPADGSPGEIVLPAGTVVHVPFSPYMTANPVPVPPAVAATTAASDPSATIAMPQEWVTRLVDENAEIQRLTHALEVTLEHCDQVVMTAHEERLRLYRLDWTLGTLAALQATPTRFSGPPDNFAHTSRGVSQATPQDAQQIRVRQQAVRALRAQLVPTAVDPLHPNGQEEEPKPDAELLELMNPGLAQERERQAAELTRRLLRYDYRDLTRNLRPQAPASPQAAPDPHAQIYTPDGRLLADHTEGVCDEAVNALARTGAAAVMQHIAHQIIEGGSDRETTALHVLGNLYIDVPHDHGSKLLSTFLKVVLALQSAAKAATVVRNLADAGAVRLLVDRVDGFLSSLNPLGPPRPITVDRFNLLWQRSIDFGNAHPERPVTQFFQEVIQTFADDNANPGAGNYEELQRRIRAIGTRYRLSDLAMRSATLCYALYKLTDALSQPHPRVSRFLGFLWTTADVLSAGSSIVRDGLKVFANAASGAAALSARSAQTVRFALSAQSASDWAGNLVSDSARFGNVVGAVGAAMSTVSLAIGLWDEIQAHRGAQRTMRIVGTSLQLAGTVLQGGLYVWALYSSTVPVAGQAVGAILILAGVVINQMDDTQLHAIEDMPSFMLNQLQTFSGRAAIARILSTHDRPALASFQAAFNTAMSRAREEDHWYELPQTTAMQRELEGHLFDSQEAEVLVSVFRRESATLQIQGTVIRTTY